VYTGNTFLISRGYQFLYLASSVPDYFPKIWGGFRSFSGTVRELFGRK
jgi:hypothetical protein